MRKKFVYTIMVIVIEEENAGISIVMYCVTIVKIVPKIAMNHIIKFNNSIIHQGTKVNFAIHILIKYTSANIDNFVLLLIIKIK